MSDTRTFYIELPVRGPDQPSKAYQYKYGWWHWRDVDGKWWNVDSERTRAFLDCILSLNTEAKNLRSALVAEGHREDCPVVAGASADCVPNVGCLARTTTATYPKADVTKAFEDVENLTEFAYEQGYHELGYDPVKTLREAFAAKSNDDLPFLVYISERGNHFPKARYASEVSANLSGGRESMNH